VNFSPGFCLAQVPEVALARDARDAPRGGAEGCSTLSLSGARRWFRK
jgi:hypothetical protein